MPGWTSGFHSEKVGTPMTPEQSAGFQALKNPWCSFHRVQELYGLDLEQDQALFGSLLSWEARRRREGEVLKPEFVHRHHLETFLQIMKFLPIKLAAVRLGMDADSLRRAEEALKPRGFYRTAASGLVGLQEAHAPQTGCLCEQDVRRKRGPASTVRVPRADPQAASLLGAAGALNLRTMGDHLSQGAENLITTLNPWGRREGTATFPPRMETEIPRAKGAEGIRPWFKQVVDTAKTSSSLRSPTICGSMTISQRWENPSATHTPTSIRPLGQSSLSASPLMHRRRVMS